MSLYLEDQRELNDIVFKNLSGILREPEPIECKRRDGFIPSSDNFGGYEAIGFISHHISLNTNSSKGVEDAERMVELALKDGEEEYLKLESPKDKQEFLDDYLEEWLIDCDQMLSIRFLYHGLDDSDGYHSATIDVSINWEAPYFRFNKGLSEVREVEIEFKDAKELDALLKKHLEALLDLFNGTEIEAY